MRRSANTTTPNRFKKRVRRTFRLAVAAAAVISIFKLCAYAEEQRRDLIRREQRHSAMINLFFAVLALAGLFAALAAAVAEMRKKNGGYAVDLFDRDEYDIVSPDEESDFEGIMRGELDGKNDDAETNQAPVDEHIPIDDEATVENF
ncbi:MAG: hypothetical protein V8T53_03430 [Eubacteriales bacterium]